MSTPEASFERVISAHRDRDPRGELVHSTDFYDMTVDERERSFHETLAQRNLERALDDRGLSSSAHAILARLR